MHRRIVSALAILCAGLFGLAECRRRRRSYPSRPIHLVTGNPPGGATDFIARAIGQPLGVRLGQSIVIDNRPGANGNISAEVVAKAAPDGYTLLYANDSLVVVNPHIYSKMSVNRDAGSGAGGDDHQQSARAGGESRRWFRSRTFPALSNLPASPPRPLFYASIGNGSHHHLAMEMLKQRAGIDLTHVPYKGGGPASIAVISGENAVMFGGTSVVGHIKNGKLKGLAVSGSKGWSTMPDLPAIGEFYPGYKSSLWHGIFAPRGNAASHPRQAAHGAERRACDAGGQRAPGHKRRRRALHHHAGRIRRHDARRLRTLRQGDQIHRLQGGLGPHASVTINCRIR